MNEEKISKNDRFNDWLTCFTITVGYDRYGMYKGHFVAIICFDSMTNILAIAEDMSGGDVDACESNRFIDESIKCGDVEIEAQDNPADAMTALVKRLRVMWDKIEAEGIR